MKNMGTLYGILITAAFMALASTVSLACLAKADDASRSAYAQDVAVGDVQTAADLVSAHRGDMSAAADTLGGEIRNGVLVAMYDADMQRIRDGEAVYVLEAGPACPDGLLGSCPVRVYRAKDGGTVFGVTATWQAENPDESGVGAP